MVKTDSIICVVAVRTWEVCIQIPTLLHSSYFLHTSHLPIHGRQNSCPAVNCPCLLIWALGGGWHHSICDALGVSLSLCDVYHRDWGNSWPPLWWSPWELFHNVCISPSPIFHLPPSAFGIGSNSRAGSPVLRTKWRGRELCMSWWGPWKKRETKMVREILKQKDQWSDEV